MDTTIRSFCTQQRDWLDQELRSEQGGQGGALSSLLSDGLSVGLYGRTVVRLVSSSESSSALRALPAHTLTTGDEVEIRTKNSSNKNKDGNQRSNGPAGVVSEVTDDGIAVALFGSNKSNNDTEDDFFANPDQLLSLHARSNIQVHRKLLDALDTLEKNTGGKVVRALFDASNLPPYTPRPSTTISAQNKGLDESQLEAISFCLHSNQPVSLIHGPPGTGKTTTVVELIRQAVTVHGWKVLVCAPSNVAVDNVLARLVATHASSTDNNNNKPKSKKNTPPKLKVVRLGHPARLQASILPYSLEALVQSADGTDIVRDVRAELQSYLKILTAPKRSGDKRLAYREVKVLRKEVRTREEKVVTDLMASAQVVLSTCVGAANHHIVSSSKDDPFDLVVIDEAAQALEVACWIPALRAKTKLVLAGDHCQLPPTIKSSAPEVQRGLGNTMFERIMELYGDADGASSRVSRMLKVQYRMHESIANWASQALYRGELTTHDSVKARMLSELVNHPNVASSEEDAALLLIDTSGSDMYESTNAAGSRFNQGEAQIVAQHVRKLLDLGVQQEEIAVISPYNGQVEILRLLLLPEAPKIQIRSVDGFQGGEREAVVLSLVRSSARGGQDGIGFLKDDRRLNVAITRAKRHCCVVCDAGTVSQSAFIKNLIDWIEEHGDVRSPLELDADDFGNDLAQAEMEVERLVAEAYQKKVKPKGPTQPKLTDSVETERRKEELRMQIQTFQAKTEQSEMVMSADLSNLDRKLVHEIAEELGLVHCSEGTKGVDRRIRLSFPKVTRASATASSKVESASVKATRQLSSTDADTLDESDEIVTKASAAHVETSSAFSSLEIHDDDANDDDKEDNKIAASTDESMNSTLATLAAERAVRERQKLAQQKQQSTKPAAKKKKKKGQKLGGTKKVEPKDTSTDDDMDDLAFLDAQIDKVQNSHGRKVQGASGYKSIVNGVLLTKPKPVEKKKDPRASASLQQKLKQAQNGRKAQPKKK